MLLASEILAENYFGLHAEAPRLHKNFRVCPQYATCLIHI